MTFQLKSVGQLLVEAATVAAIDIGAKDAADKHNRAQAALNVAAVFQAVASGDLTSGLAQAQDALLSKVTDPGQAALVTALFNIAVPQLQVLSLVNGVIPLLNGTVQGVAGEIAAGITAIASAYK